MNRTTAVHPSQYSPMISPHEGTSGEDDMGLSVKIVNENWIGKYVMVCDVIVGDVVIKGIHVSADPPVTEAVVSFPIGTSLTKHQVSAIENALLASYYDVDISRE
jgi:hypothetical protein